MAGRDFDDFAMVCNCGVDQNSIRVLLSQHPFDVDIEQLRIQVIFGSIIPGQRLLRFNNRHQGGILVSRQSMQKATHVAVDQPNDGHPDRWISRCGVERKWKNQSAERGKEIAYWMGRFVHKQSPRSTLHPGTIRRNPGQGVQAPSKLQTRFPTGRNFGRRTANISPCCGQRVLARSSDG